MTYQDSTDDAKKQAIASCDFLRDLSDASRALLVPCLQLVKLQKNQVLFLKGDPADGMYFVLYGGIEISISTEGGKKIIFNLLAPGTSFGEIGILDNGSRTADALAVENTHLLKLDHKDFVKAARQFTTDEWIRFSQRLCALLRKINSNLETLCLTNAGNRLVVKLFELGRNSLNASSKDLTLKISQSQLAEMANLTRETTNKILSQMEKEGLIKTSYGKILINDLSKLYLYNDGEESA